MSPTFVDAVRVLVAAVEAGEWDDLHSLAGDVEPWLMCPKCTGENHGAPHSPQCPAR